MVLLLLGLALLLATGSSLLVTNVSGRGGNGGSPPPKSNGTPEPGEITGSVSISSSGDLWLTIYVDYYSILAHVEVVHAKSHEWEYCLTVAGIGQLCELDEQTTLADIPPSEVSIQCGTQEEAVTKLTALVKQLSLQLTEPSLKTIPIAVECGWKEPRECQEMITSLVQKHLQE
ncbi:MAG: hypothetical protein HOC27_00315 [Phycisphaerae bacterium]|jgi:hypothetical protein|nr:hypothetical protein [Phycisphaerae bacterium]